MPTTTAHTWAASGLSMGAGSTAGGDAATAPTEPGPRTTPTLGSTETPSGSGGSGGGASSAGGGGGGGAGSPMTGAASSSAPGGAGATGTSAGAASRSPPTVVTASRVVPPLP